MSSTSMVSPFRQSNSEALSLSQKTAQYLRTHFSTILPISVPFLARTESIEIWDMHERLFYSCLRIGDDQSAHQCLEKLVNRFGTTNERIMGLRGVYQEAVAEDHSALEKILKEYEDVLAEDPVNTPIAKRRIALLRSLSRSSDAIDALVALLENSPTDIEAWAELSDLYQSQGLYAQAEFCLEEVLLVAPNAWMIHARLGELLYISVANNNDGSVGKVLTESVRRFCRSVETCDQYLRGYYGLKMATDRLLLVVSKSSKSLQATATATENADIEIPSEQVLHRLNEKATFSLAEITRRQGHSNSNQAELSAAKKLLEMDVQPRQR